MAKRVVPTRFPSIADTVDAQRFGAAVRACRTASGLTLEEAALLVGVAKATLQALELGTASVGLPLALGIARQLGVAVIVVPADQRAVAQRQLSAAQALLERRNTPEPSDLRP